MKAVNIPISFIIFLILILIFSLLILIWHISGFEIFTNTTGNVTNGVIQEISGGRAI